MDCSTTPNMLNNACFIGRIENCSESESSKSSSPSYDIPAMPKPIPSTRRWSPTCQPQESRQYPHSLGLMPPPTIPHPKLQSLRAMIPERPGKRRLIGIEPFHTARKMEEPLQPRPSSLLESRCSSAISCEGALFYTPKSMRRSKSPVGHLLQTRYSDQNITSVSMACSGTIHSAPVTDTRPASPMPKASYFECKGIRNVKMESVILERPEVEHVHEVSTARQHIPEKREIPQKKVDNQVNYLPYWKEHHDGPSRRDVKNENYHEAHPNLICQHKANKPNLPTTGAEKFPIPFTSPTSDCGPCVSVTDRSPRSPRLRTDNISGERTWLPDNFLYIKTWLQGVPEPLYDHYNDLRLYSRRKIQIVEKHPLMPTSDIIPGAKIAGESVAGFSHLLNTTREKYTNMMRKRFATASIPKPLRIGPNTSPSMAPSPSITRIPPPALLPNATPGTHNQGKEELSISSLDTSLDKLDGGYNTLEFGYSVESHQGFRGNGVHVEPRTLTPDINTLNVVGGKSELAQVARSRRIQPEIQSCSVGSHASSPAHPSLGRISNQFDNPGLEKAPLCREWTLDDHEWTLGELDYYVKEFPRQMLRLSSPVIVFLRRNEEKAFLRPFRIIFPDVSEDILDYLCAALIAHKYLLFLSTINCRKHSLLTCHDIYAVDSPLTEAYNMLKVPLLTELPNRIKDRAVASQSAQLSRKLEGIVDNLLIDICGGSDQTLKSAVVVLAQVLEANAPR